jgi:hypothetical protein
VDAAALDSAALALERFSLGRYQSPKSPMASPAAQVQIHHRTSARRLPRMISRTISAIAQPAVTIIVTSWSFASSGGGGDGRVAGSRVGSTLVGYEVTPAFAAAGA